jgi:hypothetical protein
LLEVVVEHRHTEQTPPVAVVPVAWFTEVKFPLLRADLFLLQLALAGQQALRMVLTE